MKHTTGRFLHSLAPEIELNSNWYSLVTVLWCTWQHRLPRGWSASNLTTLFTKTWQQGEFILHCHCFNKMINCQFISTAYYATSYSGQHCRNCQVYSGYHIKISDLGSVRSLYKADYFHLVPIRWTSWEALIKVRIWIKDSPPNSRLTNDFYWRVNTGLKVTSGPLEWRSGRSWPSPGSSLSNSWATGRWWKICRRWQIPVVFRNLII